MFNIWFNNKKLITKERMIRVILVIVGTFIYSTSVNLFLTPHKLIAGGVTGVGIIIEYMIGMSSMSLFLILTKNISSVYKINDMFLSTLCGL